MKLGIHSLLLLFGLVSLPLFVQAEDKEPTKDEIEFFEKKIRPLLSKHCYQCHSAEAEKVKGDLKVDTREALLKGGDTGPAAVPGKPDDSLIIKAVKFETEDFQMPPNGKISDAEIADLEMWVKMGVPYPPKKDKSSPASNEKELIGRDFWSFQPVRDHAPPAVKDVQWPLTPIDRFVLSKLEAQGLRPVALADKRTLIRRATYDLIGVPPTPEEVERFVNDAKPQAYAELIERLLASPAYGERWGRHWLDVVRYADTAGDNSDYPIPQMYKYRNWVIGAINADMPYDEFIIQQLAGDLLPSSTDEQRYDQLIATGYLANTRRFGSYEDARYQWYLTYEDTIDNLGRTFLGLTINCCRCHDHKFDPLTKEDYYALYGFFQSTRYPWPGIELDKSQHDLVPLVPRDQVEVAQKERNDQLAVFNEKIEKLEAERKQAEADIKEADKLTDEDERGKQVAAVNKKLEDLKKAIAAARKQKDEFNRKPPPYELAYAVAEASNTGKKKIGNACVQIKGDPDRLGPEVPRRFIEVLGGQTLPKDEKGSGRRQLARWIADKGNPLTARVMVNRIWHYHFGKGLVQTPSDFGKQGRTPTHPELLDWLAKEFVSGPSSVVSSSNPQSAIQNPKSAWSLKNLHRLIMLSRVYQLASVDDDANAAVDVANDYLWRFNRRRLDAESIRDTLLAVSGNLETGLGGPHPFPEQPTWDFTQHKPFKAVYDTNRRSVYLMTQRIQRHPFLALFDGADTNTNTPRRTVSTTPLQALYLMNDPFLHQQSTKFAARLLAERSDDQDRINLAYQLLFARAAESNEQSEAKQYLAQVRDTLKTGGVSVDQQATKAWESLVRVLFMSNEFVYVN